MTDNRTHAKRGVKTNLIKILKDVKESNIKDLKAEYKRRYNEELVSNQIYSSLYYAKTLGEIEMLDTGFYRIADTEPLMPSKSEPYVRTETLVPIYDELVPNNLNLDEKNLKFLNRMYKVDDCSSPEEFLNKIIEKHIFDLFEEFI